MKKKRKNWISRILILILVCYVAGTFINQRIKLHDLNKEQAQLQKQITQLKKEANQLKLEKKKSNDLKYIEKAAREDLKMVKSNEIIYIDTNRTKYILNENGDKQ